MVAWLNPGSLFMATFVAGLLAHIAFPRQGWSTALVIAVAPLVFLTATIWWRIWEQDALWAVAYLIVLMICCGASLSSMLAVAGVRWLLRR